MRSTARFRVCLRVRHGLLRAPPMVTQRASAISAVRRDPDGQRSGASAVQMRSWVILFIGVVAGYLVSFMMPIPPRGGSHGRRANKWPQLRRMSNNSSCPSDDGRLSEYLEQRLKVVDTSYRAKCRAVMMGTDKFSQAWQDTIAFSRFFSGMDRPGVYLDLGANDAKQISNTLFLDKCLGWKGVTVEPNPMYWPSYAERSSRLVKHCVGTRENQTVTFAFAYGVQGHIGGEGGYGSGPSVCLTLEQILQQNADILGSPDSTGAWGTNINYVSVDVEGHEHNILGCTDLTKLFSRETDVQVWTIENNHCNGDQLRTIDAAMGLAGYAKTSPNIQFDGTFLDDIYVRRRLPCDKEPFQPPQHKCNGTRTCSLVDLMALKTATSNC